jgi:hypothetical protein
VDRTHERKRSKGPVTKCPKGHELVRFKTPQNSWTCSKCKGEFAKGTVLAGCDKCKFDLCEFCTREGRTSLARPVPVGADLSPEEESSSLPPQQEDSSPLPPEEEESSHEGVDLSPEEEKLPSSPATVPPLASKSRLH